MIMTNEFKCMTIVGTCIQIMLDILNRDPLATFGFIGSNTYDPVTKTTEPMDQTKRWRVYKHAMEAQMETETFTHVMLPELSRYVMVNKQKNTDFILAEIERVFSELFDKDIRG